MSNKIVTYEFQFNSGLGDSDIEGKILEVYYDKKTLSLLLFLEHKVLYVDLDKGIIGH